MDWGSETEALEKVKLIVSCGDVNQSKPSVISESCVPKVNESSMQYALSYPSRLDAIGFPSIKIDTQYRMSEGIAEFPNRYVYKNHIENCPNVASIRPNQNFLAMMHEYIPSTDNMNKGYIMVDIGNSCAIVDERGYKYNNENIAFDVKLVKRNHEAEGYKAKDICILTPSKAQQTR